MYLFDPTHSSHPVAETQIDASNVNTLGASGSFMAQPFGGAPTVVSGVAYIGDWGGNFYAIRTSDGALLWKQFVGLAATPGNPICMPAIGVTGQSVIKDGVVYVPGGDSALYALDRQSGSQIWRVQLADPESGSYIWSSLTLLNNSIYLGMASLGDCPVVRGALIRVDLNNPQLPVYSYVMSEDDVGAGIWSTPAFDTDTNTIYAATGNGAQDVGSGSYGSTFLSFDAQSLEIKAYFFLPTVSDFGDDDWGSSPTLFQTGDGTKLVAATAKDGVLYVLNAADMTPVWTAKLAEGCDDPFNGCGSLSTPAFDGTTLYVGAGSMVANGANGGNVYAFSPTGDLLWSSQTPGVVVAPVTVANGLVFVSTLSGLMALDANSGKSLWDDGGAGPLYSQPVISDGTVYAAYANGNFVAYRLNGQGQPPPGHRPVDPHR
jgi:outer membrane protein assembly factor BamB